MGQASLGDLQGEEVDAAGDLDDETQPVPEISESSHSSKNSTVEYYRRTGS
jgi:hypothetical protein